MSAKPKRGPERRVMYVENKNGTIEGVGARIGWVEFSKSGQTIYYRGLMLQKGVVPRGNCFDVVTGETYWVSDVKKRGSNAHPDNPNLEVEVDPDALDEYRRIRSR
ncbi:hypothetical protein [Methylopila turkensis]|uniref:1-deoxy-D-xylulose-5-phosphate synthase n=1 Tax=Methylopila turkensis TaxID=1437816 RepID=A0A9W6JML3_9HYPH|nr:hypothetical protein [Methylopila turkensis]GLK79952.1 hypothetical protein GCM10008174_16930 [Methylopila turkensis]